ncbi:MAG: hypothetical protein R2850_08130 [Bacteroidia bacterium]
MRNPNSDKDCLGATQSQIYSLFDEVLFKALAPPFPKMELLQFDGCLKGDEVKVKLHFGLFTQHWDSLITESGSDTQKSFFIDEGTRLPFFLKSWKHTHLIRQAGEDVFIEDNIDLKWSSPFWSVFVYPGLYLSFLYRKPVYRRYFSKNERKFPH